jgi:hypothetical protein
MKRQLLILFTLSALVVFLSAPAEADHGRGGALGARGGRSHGHRGGQGIGRLQSFGRGHGHGHGFDSGFGVGGFLGFGYGWDLAELYRELYDNVPHFALHPPVYYSYPVPRTYGYSPFAYPPGVMTPDVVGQAQPLDIINPYVPKAQEKPVSTTQDRSAATMPSRGNQPQPLVIINPFVSSTRAVARSER